MKIVKRSPQKTIGLSPVAAWAFVYMTLFSLSGCATNVHTTRAGTTDILNVHQAIAHEETLDFSSAKLVFFGDLHRGMGAKDFFKDNRKLWIEILKYYFDEGFSLVLIGDIEEGWGFQADNVPLILQWYKNAFLLEEEFARAGRYYRLYGNHDDYYRSNPVGYSTNIVAPAYPALIFKDKNSDRRMFVTHGCQGHALHDAGDQLAAWGVFARFNWLLQILPKKKSEGMFAKEAKRISADYDKHEQYFYDWAVANGFDILIAGHTHRPIYNLNGVHYSYQVLKEDINRNKLPIFTYYSDEDIVEVRGGEQISVQITQPQISASSKDRMIKALDEEARTIKAGAIIQARTRARGMAPTEYYNPGCGYLSEIPCIEMSDGKISHKYFRLDPNGQLEWMVLDPKTKGMIKGSPLKK